MPVLSEKCFSATRESLPEILGWVEEQSMELLPMALAMKLQLAAEEAIVNVVNFAYAPDAVERPLTMRFGKEDNYYLELVDYGVHFDPLKNIKVDPTQPLEDRVPGGWGRELIVKMTSAVTYTRQDNANVLRMEENVTDVPDLPD